MQTECAIHFQHWQPRAKYETMEEQGDATTGMGFKGVGVDEGVDEDADEASGALFLTVPILIITCLMLDASCWGASGDLCFEN